MILSAIEPRKQIERVLHWPLELCHYTMNYTYMTVVSMCLCVYVFKDSEISTSPDEGEHIRYHVVT